MDESATSLACISIRDQVISKIRSELVSNGELKLSLLNEIHATWQRKMIQAGAFETSGSKPVTQDPNPLPGYAESGVYIDAQFPSTELEMFIKKGSYIPQIDGSSDGDAADIKPNTCSLYGDAADIKKPNTYAPYGDDAADIKPNIYAPYGDAADIKPNTYTPYDDEELNENDDDVEEGGGIHDDDIPHLIVCQFDHVKKKKTGKTRNKWECKLKAGVMDINGKQILFSEAKGDFDF